MEPKKYLKRETHKDNCKQYRVFHEIKEEEKHTTKKHEFIYTGKLKKKFLVRMFRSSTSICRRNSQSYRTIRQTMNILEEHGFM